MKDLKDMLIESLNEARGISNTDAEKAIFDLLVAKNKESRAHMSDDDLRDLANEVLDWYENEEELLNHKTVDSFISYVEDDILSMADAADQEYQDKIHKLWSIREGVNESVDAATAESMILDVLQKRAKVNCPDYPKKIDDSVLQNLANQIATIYDKEGELRKHNKSNFDKFLEKDDYFAIYTIADTDMSLEDHDLVYKLMGQ